MAKEEPKRLEMTREELDAFFDRLERDELTAEDRGRIREVMTAVVWMAQKLEDKDLSIKRLQRLFGIKTEKAENLFGNQDGPSGPSGGKPATPPRNRSDEHKPSGHNGADDYPDAECVFHPHETHKIGDPCPLCSLGTLYSYGTGTVLRLRGQPPIAATIHQPEQLRCSACQALFTASLPSDAGSERAEASAKAMVALLRYGGGVPFYRLDKLQEMMRTPLPDATQWDMSESLANLVKPVYQVKLHLAAQAELLHADDTGMKILHLKKKLLAEKSERTGIFTTGVLSLVEGREIALFFTGDKHAGERMEKILKTREAGRVIPKLMCDALSRNKPKDTPVKMANCLDHARRGFVDILSKYPEEVQYFVTRIGDVYIEDRNTKLLKMTAEERLAHHQAHSLSIMEELKTWCALSLHEKTVEPNSPLGAVMNYFLNHYEKLTMFAKEAGVPLSNAAVERLLKTAVLHRKNSLFYLTETGAIVGDILMSLIQTAKRAQVNVLDYLTQLQLCAADVKKNPEQWLPWNYIARLAVLHQAS